MFNDFEIREQGFSDDGEDIVTREYTNELISLVKDGTLDAESVLENLVNWLSEQDVYHFSQDEYSEFFDKEEEKE
jgi:hypothetical protein